MIKINKYIFLLILIFTSACNSCGLSEKCFRDKEKNRIINLTQKERENEKQQCIKNYEHLIKTTKNKKRECGFWKCVDGKEDWESRLNSCIWRLENIK